MLGLTLLLCSVYMEWESDAATVRPKPAQSLGWA